MKAALKLELIGDNIRMQFEDCINQNSFSKVLLGDFPPDTWVADVTDSDKKYLTQKRDYSQANGTGSRGVYAWYTLESCRIYEVKERVSWKRTRHYYVRVTEDGDIVECQKNGCSE